MLFTVDVDGGEHVVHPLHLPERRPACGEGKRADPGVFPVERSAATTKEDAFIVARGSHEDRRRLLEVFGPARQEILNVLKNVFGART